MLRRRSNDAVYWWSIAKHRWGWVNLFFPTLGLKLLYAPEIIASMSEGFTINRQRGRKADVLQEARSGVRIKAKYPYHRQHIKIQWYLGRRKSSDTIFWGAAHAKT
jgi:hypothetical protein